MITKEKCPYVPCGSNDACIGCKYDTKKRSMNSEMFKDCCCHLGCGDCKYCNPSADLDNVESRCKRLDHKHIQFAIPWFKSYDCGQLSGGICEDFEPNEWEFWLFNHWKPEYKKSFCKGNNGTKKTVGLCLDKNQSVRYYVDYMDFFYNTFKNDDGSLKWIYKQYYKQCKKSPMKYILVTEYNNERKNYGSN